MAYQTCPPCDGWGKRTKDGKEVECPACKGRGVLYDMAGTVRDVRPTPVTPTIPGPNWPSEEWPGIQGWRWVCGSMLPDVYVSDRPPAPTYFGQCGDDIDANSYC